MSAPLTVDARSDVWALGIILYQLVAGRTPFHGETIHAVYALVLSGQPTPLAAYRPDAPPGFEAVIARCLAKDRAMRFADVAEFAAALVPYAPPHARGYADRVGRIVRGGRASSSSAAEIVVSTAAAPVVATAPLPQTVMGASPQVIAQSAAPVTPTSPQPKGKPLGWIVGLVAVGAVLAFVGTGVLVYALGLGQTNPVPAQSVVAKEPAAVEAKAEGAVKVEPRVEPMPVTDAPSATPISSAVVPAATVKAAAAVKSVETKAPAVSTVKTKKRNEDLYNP
jgi:serine/threonine-protein kinase